MGILGRGLVGTMGCIVKSRFSRFGIPQDDPAGFLRFGKPTCDTLMIPKAWTLQIEILKKFLIWSVRRHTPFGRIGWYGVIRVYWVGAG